MRSKCRRRGTSEWHISFLITTTTTPGQSGCRLLASWLTNWPTWLERTSFATLTATRTLEVFSSISRCRHISGTAARRGRAQYCRPENKPRTLLSSYKLIDLCCCQHQKFTFCIVKYSFTLWIVICNLHITFYPTERRLKYPSSTSRM